MSIGHEELGYWYLRLNGFLSIPNFVVHPDRAGNQLTDVDVIGVRFPFRSELLENPMIDDDPFTREKQRPFVVIAEMKSGLCQLNRPIRDGNRDVLHRILSSVGMLEHHEIEGAIAGLQETGCYYSDRYDVRFLALGEQVNEDLRESHPDALQITWYQVLTFIYQRFQSYRGLKWDHPQWDRAGRFLWEAAAQLHDVQEFRAFVNDVCFIEDRSR